MAIHASKSFPKWARDLCRENPFYAALSAVMTFRQGLPFYNGYTDVELEEPEKYLPLGCIVAVCDLVDVLPIVSPYHTDVAIRTHLGIHARGPGSELADREKAFGDYSPGRYMLPLSNVKALDKPIPAKGRLGLWEFEMPNNTNGVISK